MVIDVHGHLGRLRQRESSPPLLNRYLDHCRIDRLLVSNLDAASSGDGAVNLDEADANLACLTACRQHKRWVPLYWVRPGKVDSNIHAFTGALSAEPFAGVVFSPVLNDFSADAALLDPYLLMMARVGVPGLFHVAADDNARPVTVYRVAKRHPNLPLILYNAAEAGLWAEALEIVRRATDRDDANLYLATGYASIGEVLVAVGGAGLERVLYGSDATCYGQEHASRCLKLLDGLRAALPEETAARIIGGNAATLFTRLGE
jgi:predicted TIM-barrel fold metal-dependent hydrolase